MVVYINGHYGILGVKNTLVFLIVVPKIVCMI